MHFNATSASPTNEAIPLDYRSPHGSGSSLCIKDRISKAWVQLKCPFTGVKIVQIHRELSQGEVNPVQTLLDLAGGYAVPRCLHVVADLGVADVLGEIPRTAADLADELSADPYALGRVLRLLAAHRIFAVQGEAFTHTPASQLLRTDRPGIDARLCPNVRAAGLLGYAGGVT